MSNLMSKAKAPDSLVLVGQHNGVAVIPQATPLTRLNYFDGKFLRASDLKAEQDYLRQLVMQSNQAGGSGVAYGYDVTLGSGDTLAIGAGLALDAQGRVILLPKAITLNIQQLIEQSRALQSLLAGSTVQRDGSFETCQLNSATPPVNVLAAGNLFVITIAQAEALCGEEDVFGKLCEEACVTSTDRPFVIEGLIVRAVPLLLQTPLITSKAIPLAQIHLRSRVAAAYFEDERRRIASLISKTGLAQATWCLGADSESGSGVPIGVLAREGSNTVFLDPWIARRERIDTPAKRYWQWRMLMRPWDVFLAQVLQFQCQLHDLFGQTVPGGETDPCAGARDVLQEAASTLAEVKNFYTAAARRFIELPADVISREGLLFSGGESRLSTLNNKLLAVGAALATTPQDRLLIRGGIVELPSAGYLPVLPGSALTINQQVRQLLGDGLDLRFCVVRPDFVAHALEEAQHMERISLLQGLGDTANRPEVDILVPDGEIVEQAQLSPGRGFVASLDVNTALLTTSSENNTRVISNRTVRFEGAARFEQLATGGSAFYLAAGFALSRLAATVSDGTATTTNRSGAATGANTNINAMLFNRAGATLSTTDPRAGSWIGVRCEHNMFELRRGDTTNFNAQALVAATTLNTPILELELNGVLQIVKAATGSGSTQTLAGRIDNAQFSSRGVVFGDSGERKTLLIDLTATVTLSGTTALDIVLGFGQSRIEFSASWDKQPLEVKLAARILSEGDDGNGTVTEMAAAVLNENADVLSAGNAAHRRALAALEIIAGALGDINFADAKTRLLFPPPPPPQDQLIVRGTRDWVLFHRRRNKRCSQDQAPPPQPAAARLYQIYHFPVNNLDEAESLRRILLSGQVPNDPGPQAVAVIEFSGGVAALVTPPDAVRSDWQQVSPGNILVYSAIANRDSAAADGETLARSRLDRLEDTLAPISRLDPQAQTDLLSGVPAALPAAGVDGVMILFSRNQLEQVCHSVFRVENQDSLQRIIAAFQAGQPDTAIGQFSAPLGEVNFTGGSTQPVDDGSIAKVLEKWQDNGGGTPAQALVVMQQGDNRIGQTLALQQGSAIAQALGVVTALPAPQFVISPAAFPENITCAALTFVAAQPARTALGIIAGLAGNNDHLISDSSQHVKVSFSNNVPQGNELQKLISELTDSVIGVSLAVLTPPADAEAAKRIDAVVSALKAAGRAGSNPGTSSGSLRAGDRRSLLNSGIALDGVDEVIFLEVPVIL